MSAMEGQKEKELQGCSDQGRSREEVPPARPQGIEREERVFVCSLMAGKCC